MTNDQTRPSSRTRETEREDARTEAHADREPTDDEAKTAERIKPDPKTAAHYEEMAERGANQKGEGRLP